MKKRLLKLIIATSLVILSVGCGKAASNEAVAENNTVNENKEETVLVENTEEEPEAAVEEIVEEVQEEKEVKGHWVPLQKVDLYDFYEIDVYDYNSFPTDALNVSFNDTYNQDCMVFHWNEDYSVIEEVDILNDSQKVNWNEKLFYSADGNLEKIDIYYVGMFRSEDYLLQTKYFDENGSLKQIDVYDEADSEHADRSYYYDENGLFEHMEYADGWTITYKYEYADDKVVKATENYGNGTTTTKFKYDDNGNIIKRVDADMSHEYDYVEMNGEFRLKEARSHAKDEDGNDLEFIHSIEYDDKGDIVKLSYNHIIGFEDGDVDLSNVIECENIEMPDIAVEGTIIERKVGDMVEQYIFVAD